MSSPLAELALDPMLSGLTQAGALGVVTAILFYLNHSKDKRLDQLIATINQNATKTNDAIHHLTRALTLEVLTREGVMERAKEEAREIQDSIGRP